MLLGSQALSQYICRVLVAGYVIDGDLSRLDSVADIVVADIDVFCALIVGRIFANCESTETVREQIRRRDIDF